MRDTLPYIPYNKACYNFYPLMTVMFQYANLLCDIPNSTIITCRYKERYTYKYTIFNKYTRMTRSSNSSTALPTRTSMSSKGTVRFISVATM